MEWRALCVPSDRGHRDNWPAHPLTLRRDLFDSVPPFSLIFRPSGFFNDRQSATNSQRCSPFIHSIVLPFSTVTSWPALAFSKPPTILENPGKSREILSRVQKDLQHSLLCCMTN